MAKIYVYIKRSLPGQLIEFEKPLSEEEYDNIGNTWEDYLDNMWVQLNDEQLAYHTIYPEATIQEIWNRQPTPRTLEQAKYTMLSTIDSYDKSNNVNSFLINNTKMWLNVEEREQLATQISANEAIGRTEMTRWFNGLAFTFTLTQWKQMLIALEVYAGDALNVTESHKAAVNALTTIEEIDSYDYMTGYPEKLVFNS